MAVRALVVFGIVASLAPVSMAHADARGQQAERVLAQVERDLARDDERGATERLARALARPGDLRLAVRYAELALPLDFVLAPARLRARGVDAERYLAALARSSPSGNDPELARRSTLYAGWAAALLGRDDEAASYVHAAGQLQDPLTVSVLRHVAALAATKDDLARAERALDEARQYLPQDLALAGELGMVQLARGQSERAIATLQARFATDPGLGARRDLAYALAASGRADEAVRLLEIAQEACDAQPGCGLEAARYALEAGRPEAAVTLSARSLARDPRDLDALFVAADAQARTGAFDEARASYGRILALKPDSVRAREGLAALPAGSNPHAR